MNEAKKYWPGSDVEVGGHDGFPEDFDFSIWGPSAPVGEEPQDEDTSEPNLFT